MIEIFVTSWFWFTVACTCGGFVAGVFFTQHEYDKPREHPPRNGVGKNEITDKPNPFKKHQYD